MTTTFPVIAFTLSPQALARDILPGFGVGAVVECKFHSGGFNDTYRVKTVDGSPYHLRAYCIQWRTLADIQYELDVLNHLKRKGFPAAKPVPYKGSLPACSHGRQLTHLRSRRRGLIGCGPGSFAGWLPTRRQAGEVGARVCQLPAPGFPSGRKNAGG